MFDHCLHTCILNTFDYLKSATTAEYETLSCVRKDFFYNFIHISIYSESEYFTLVSENIRTQRSRKARLVRLHASDLSVHSSRDIVSGPGGPSDVRALPGDERLFST